MNGWKYQAGSVALILARKDDFAGVPQHVQAAFEDVIAARWGDRPGNQPAAHLIGASRADIEAALESCGWFLYTAP